MKVSNTSCFVFILLLFATVSAQAQRPKIGLTLSGGGAKGLVKRSKFPDFVYQFLE